MTVSVFGVPVSRISIEDCLDQIWAMPTLRQATGGPAFTVALANACSVVEANRNLAHMEALQEADLVLADGLGVALLARTPKIAGADLMLAAARHPELAKMRYLLLGGFGVAYKAALTQWHLARLQYARVGPPWLPDVPDSQQIVEVWAGDDQMVQWANAVDHDILWVALGCPRQEIWMQENRHRLKAKVVIAVGAAFDMLAGRIPRAPAWMRPIGLEWAWRIWQEPKRWRRQVDAAVGFLRLLCR